MMLENAFRATAQLPAVTRPQVSAVMVSLLAGGDVKKSGRDDFRLGRYFRVHGDRTTRAAAAAAAEGQR